MRIAIVILFVVLSCIGACTPKPAPVSNQQLILNVPEQLMQEPAKLQELKE